jgi:hypothetical protein
LKSDDGIRAERQDQFFLQVLVAAAGRKNVEKAAWRALIKYI